mmetsp:Transcript_24504/g.40852  ORF Transcript_24504/g.40852 Transcript_24504/m.40852 type:complete len:197 (+) Transcript_24504:102-692(+)
MSASDHLLDEIDERKDYYKTLGVHPEASVEELRAAYVVLALQHHPDTAEAEVDSVDSSTSGQDSEFIKVAEAWRILSKPDAREQYNRLRGRYLGLTGKFGTHQQSFNDFPSEIPMGYNTQRANFHKVQAKASSNWTEIQSKYKNEKWHNLPLSERKLRRSRQLKSAPGQLLTMLLPVVLFGGIAYGTYKVQSKYLD